MQTLPGLAQYCCQQPREAAWALPALQKAPGTLHHHTMFSDWEIVPWACCAETASPKIGVVSSSSPKLPCPGPLWRRLCLKQDHHAASASSVCVWPCLWQHSHIPQRLLVELLGTEQQMMLEKQGFCFSGGGGDTI